MRLVKLERLGDGPKQFVCGGAGRSSAPTLSSVLSLKLFSFEMLQCHFKELLFWSFTVRTELVSCAFLSCRGTYSWFSCFLDSPLPCPFSYPLPGTCSPPPLQTLLSIEICMCKAQPGWDLKQGDSWLNGFSSTVLECAQEFGRLDN